MRGELLAPVFGQHRFKRRAGRWSGVIPFGFQPHQATADQAGVAAVEVRAGIAGGFGCAPLRRRFDFAEDVVVGVEGIDVRSPFGEFGVEGEAQQATVAAVVDVGAEVGEDFGSGVFEIFENEDFSRLRGNENATIGSEAEVHGFFQVADRDAVLETRRQRRLSRGAAHARAEQHQDRDKRAGPMLDRAHPRSSGAMVSPAESSCSQ